VGLLVITVLPGTEAIAPEVNGARRWLRVGISIQPSELAKLAVIIWTATIAVKKQDQFKSMTQGLGPFFLIWAMVLVPILLQPNLSTALVIAALGLLLVFAAGARVAHFAFLALLVLPFVRNQLEVGFRAGRIDAFLNPARDPGGAGFQLLQSLVAVGSGGVTGVGFGEGRQKFGFLPEAHNDFIFSMVGEEWGLVGIVLLVATYLALIPWASASPHGPPTSSGSSWPWGSPASSRCRPRCTWPWGWGCFPPPGWGSPCSRTDAPTCWRRWRRSGS
jgi:cell division protein FtsW